MLKTCRSCKIEKKLEEFGRRSGMPDGLNYICKQCNRSKTLEWHKNNYAKSREYARNYADKNRSKLNAVRRENYRIDSQRYTKYTQKYYEKNKHKALARSMLGHAIKMGYLVKPDTCKDCLLEAKRLEAHHINGYDRAGWYDVDFLCKKCHGLRHRAALVQ